jgi:U3 small nucleolar RNA-associated protein 14
MVTMAEAARIYDRAGREEKTTSSWARDVILNAIREDANHE